MTIKTIVMTIETIVMIRDGFSYFRRPGPGTPRKAKENV